MCTLAVCPRAAFVKRVQMKKQLGRRTACGAVGAGVVMAGIDS